MNGKKNKLRNTFYHFSVLVHQCLISLWEIKRQHQGLTLNCLLIATGFLQHATKFILLTDTHGGSLITEVTDKTGISKWLSNQHISEYLCKGKQAKYLCSRHKYLLLRVRSHPWICNNYPSAPTICLRRGTALHQGRKEALLSLSTPAGSVPSPSRSACTELTIYACYYESDITSVQAQSDIYS